MKKNGILAMIILLAMTMQVHAQRQYFDKSKDLLLAQYDLRPDEDDVQSVAALGSMLLHSDLNGVNYYAVAGSYGIQDGTFLVLSIPDFFNLAFGPKNTKWTDAHNDRENSRNRVRDQIVNTINNGGKVFIAEAGQSDFTYDVLQKVINQTSITAAQVKSKVIVVQHSWRNEDKSDMVTGYKLDWVKANTDYEHIDDGNRDDNDTPGYASYSTSYMNAALASSNPNTCARELWSSADEICSNFTATYENPKIAGGGVDYSDHVEVWWILNQGSTANTVSSFFSRYVTNSTGSSCDGNIAPTVSFSNPTNGQLFPSPSDISVLVDASDSDGTVTGVELYLDGTLIREETGAPYEWGLSGQNDAALQNLTDGRYTLRAVATDNDGAFSENSVTITVGTPPSDVTVSFANIADGASFSAPADVYVLANASTVNSSISNVRLYLNGTLVRQENVAPYEWGAANQNDPSLTDMASGTYTLRVEATDNTGETGEASISITVSDNQIDPTGVTVSPSSLSLNVGQTSDLTETVAPSNATNKSVTWASSNTSVATVSNSGLVTGVAEGIADITVTTSVGGFTAICDVTVSDIPSEQSPYGGTNGQIPGTIEAEEYDLGGINIAYYDNSSGNSGGDLRTDDVDIAARDNGYVVGWTASGEWLEYTVDATGGTYTMTARIATTNSNVQLNVELGSTLLGTINVPNTGSWQTYQEVVLDNIVVPDGNNQILRVTWVGGSTNLNWLNFSSNNTPDLDPVIHSVSSAQSVNPASNILDGDASDPSRWSSNTGGFPQWVIIDYGSNIDITGTRLWTYQSRDYQFRVEASTSATTGYSTIVDRTANTSSAQPISDDFASVTARYIRLTITGKYTYTGNWCSINEFSIVSSKSVESSLQPMAVADIYPNPVLNELNIMLPTKHEYVTVQITDITGNILSSQELDFESNYIQIPFDGMYTSGLYLVRLIGRQGTSTYKVLKK